MDLSDKDVVRKVVEACIRGESKYQQALYKQLYSPMMAVCYRYAGRPEDAKDLFQEGFIKVFNKIDRFNFEGSLEGWIRRIMVNHAIDHYRKNKKKFAMSETLVEAERIPDEDSFSDNWYDQVNVKELLNCVQQLSPMYRTVFSLYVLDDYTHAEIAEELDISEGTSKSNLSKAKKNLKKMVIDQLRNEA
jgi:RNA polymerase sigma-70 factor (ECF subfamily)